MWSKCIVFLCSSYLILSDGCKILDPTKFAMKLEREEDCPGMPPINEQQIPVYINIHKHNRTTTVLNINITFSRDFDDSFHLHVRIARWGDGGWKENWIQFRRRDACHAIHYLMGRLWTAFAADFNDQKATKCPIPKGFYQVVNHRPPVEKNPIPLCEGQIKVEFKVLRNEEVCLCKLYYLNNEPIL